MYIIKDLPEFAEWIESNNRVEKAEKEIRKNKIKELMAEGIDKTVASVMVDAYISCGIF